MKKVIVAAFALLLISGINSCKKEPENQWKIDIKDPVEKVDIVDISKSFYDPTVSLETFKKDFPWYQGSVSDADFAERRLDPREVKIYKEAISKINSQKLNTDLSALFSHIKTYFPSFKSPKVFLYSTAAYYDSITNPVFYKAEENYLFIDISGFLGYKNETYEGLDYYIQKSMNPANLIPKVSLNFAESMVSAKLEHQKFLDQLIYNGKIQILQDAFLPDTPDYLKLNYTKEQEAWNIANEANIWNYFVENDLIFSSDSRLAERFITPGPFSKFYTEIDNDSSPQVGIWIGWQICKKYLAQHPNVKLKEFLAKPASEIFEKTEYKPKSNN